MRARVPAAVFACLLVGPGWGQSVPATVRGTVRDTTGRPIAAVQLYVVGTRVSAQTDSRGHYELTLIVPGTTRVRATILGYPYSEQAIVLGAGEEASLDFRLVPFPPEPGLVVQPVQPETRDSQ